MLYLETDRLRVEIADPAGLQTQTTRFDHSAFIEEITLDGDVRFCASEPRNMKDRTSGGRGLCSEYKFDVSGEAPAGGVFPKLGVGLLRKENDEEYHFARPYACEPFAVETQHGERLIRFTTQPQPCLGYAARTSRTVTVWDNVLEMQMELYNAGERTISFSEYCHNFLSLGGMALGADYCLQLSGCRNLEERIIQGRRSFDFYRVKENTVHMTHHSPCSVSFRLFEGDFPDQDTFAWRMEHQSAQIIVEGKEWYRPAKMVVWSNNHMLCPEGFFSASVTPGESCVWKRSWRFEQIPR